MDVKCLYKQYAWDVAEREGIPPAIFLSQMYKESRWNPKAYNKQSKASGLGQVIPQTAFSLGLKDPFNPKQNLEKSAKYLKLQYLTYGNWKTALAAYNAGPCHVQDYLNGTNNCGQNSKRLKTPYGIPNFKETKDYVYYIFSVAKRDFGYIES